MKFTDASVLALYPPIIFFALWAVFLYGGNVILPAMRMHLLNVKDHSLPIAIVLCSAALLIENIFYGFARVDPQGYNRLTLVLPFIGPMKAIILCGLVFAVAGYKKAVEGKVVLAKMLALALAIWMWALVALLVFR